MPPAMHIVTTAYFTPRRRPSMRTCPARPAPHTGWMTDRDRAAVDVEPLGRNAETLLAVDRLRCKCFVELTNALISAPISNTASVSGSFSAGWIASGSWRRTLAPGALTGVIDGDDENAVAQLTPDGVSGRFGCHCPRLHVFRMG